MNRIWKMRNSYLIERSGGDTDIVLEIDKQTLEVKKTANDFRKIVEIELETIEEILMKNEVRKP